MAGVLWDVPVRYVNSQGETFVLQGDGMGFVDILPLYSFAWSYELADSINGDGGTATGFMRKPRAVELELRNRGGDRTEFTARMNALHAASEVDAIAERPGRLWLGDQYMTCFLAVSGSVSSAPRNAAFSTAEISVLAVRPYWCTERVTEFYPPVSGEGPGDNGKKYDLKNAYRYGTSIASNDINNRHYAEAPAIITIYGPATGPAVTIDGNAYGVSVAITASQRLVIDGAERQIYTIGSGGERTDLFNSRIKTGDAFKPIAPGEHRAFTNEDFRMQIKLIERRSQPRWIE